MSEKYFSLESIKQDIEWLQNAGSQELLLREVLGRFEYGAIHAADVRPVVHGRFVHDGPRFAGGVDWWHCSNCGSLVSGVETRFAFCPHCGADMRPNGRRST